METEIRERIYEVIKYYIPENSDPEKICSSFEDIVHDLAESKVENFVKASYLGLKEKLQKILNEYAEYIERGVAKRDKFLSRIEFCQFHNLGEEERITRVKYDAVNMIIYRWQNMHKEIQELLNKWLS